MHMRQLNVVYLCFFVVKTGYPIGMISSLMPLMLAKINFY